MSKSFRVQLKDVLENYTQEVGDILNATAEELAIEAAQKLKENSPSSKGRKKKYNKGWAIKVLKTGYNAFSYVIHNKNKPGLTQLLEFPHPMRNGQMTYEGHGRREHIKPVADWVAKEYEKRVKDALRNGK